jgi:hypothetical protein
MLCQVCWKHRHVIRNWEVGLTSHVVKRFVNVWATTRRILSHFTWIWERPFIKR